MKLAVLGGGGVASAQGYERQNEKWKRDVPSQPYSFYSLNAQQLKDVHCFSDTEYKDTGVAKVEVGGRRLKIVFSSFFLSLTLKKNAATCISFLMSQKYAKPYHTV